MNQTLSQLLIDEIKLQPGQEWPVAGGSWRFARVHSGAAYWLGADRMRALAESEMIVLGPKIQGSIRASQISEVVLHAFNFAPDMLPGFFTMAERHFFETAAAKNFSEAQFLPSTHPAVQQLAEILAEPDEQQSLIHRAELLALVVSIFNGELARHRLPAPRSMSAEFRFQQLISKMPDTEFINHTPEDLARLCGCSPRHFSRLFQHHFGTSARERQSELRLLKAKRLLAETGEKIIQVALECGYRNVSLFNSMFKERFEMTPSEFRRKATRKNGAALWIAMLAAIFFAVTSGATTQTTNETSTAQSHSLILGTPASASDLAKARDALHQKLRELNRVEERKKLFPLAPTNSVAATNAMTFEVKRYDLHGNTLLPPDTIDLVTEPYTGPKVTIDQIKSALGDLQLTYRKLGYVTVAVALPPQQLTNGVVKVQVTEGRLAAVNVVNNHYFSSNNIMRSLPSLRTNILLNANVLQRELDAANANRDRQISPVIAPGPEPGTSVLELRVKDRRPFHARLELNNDTSTPNTPEMRVAFNATYGNLWDLGHTAGIQYGFSPEAMKSNLRDAATPFDDPLIANYSAYYRMPLGQPQAVQREIDASNSRFGYNETTRRFELPPASGQTELSFYASRSTSDTGVQLGALQAVSTNNSLLKIFSQDSGEDVTLNEQFGTKLSVPLRNEDDNGVRAIASFGLDFKRFRMASYNTNNFYETITFTNSSGAITTNYTVSSGQPTRYVAVDYLPFNAGLDLTIPDRFGVTFIDGTLNANIGSILSRDSDFAAASYSPNARANYVTLQYGISRDQSFYHDWGVAMRLNGQLANSALISNEQFPLGGQNGVRGYRDGSTYGDSGWRIQIEPHSPYLNCGMVDGTLPMMARVYGFFDCGQTYLHDSAPLTVATLAGTGVGVNATIGSHLDFRFQIGVALHDTPAPAGAAPFEKAGDVRVTFGIGAQF
jgi:hemolysin activation/secretion protein/AraC-like DNA-binding protein